MKKVLFTLLILSTALFSEIKWQSSYETAIKKARQLDRPVLAVLVSKHCRWCKKLEQRTLADPKIEEFINTHFVPVILVREEGGYPDYIKSRYVPATFYITPQEKFLMKPVAGYWEPYDYMSDLELADRIFKKTKSRTARQK